MSGAPDIPTCPYCQKPAELVTGRVLYPRCWGDVARKNFFRCAPCSAWVGVHEGTLQPFGRLANAELRTVRQHAHNAFDRLWEGKMLRDGCSKGKAREAGYQWLAAQLGIPRADCHIGMMDVEMCTRVVQVCQHIPRREAAE